MDDQPSPTFLGLRTMLRMPHVSDRSDWPGDGVGVVGIPFDIAVTNRPGARFGPAAIREASLMLSDLPHYPSGIEMSSLGIDTGDVNLDLHHPYSTPAAITDHVGAIIAAGRRPLSLGGDHYVTLPVLRAIAKQHGPVALVHFDAHTDTWEPDDDDELNHGGMFVFALREGLIDPSRSVQVGIRTHNDNTRGLTIIDASLVRSIGPQATARQIVDIVGAGPAYFTFDVDVLDPTYAPGTGTPVAGGLSTGVAQDIMRGLVGIEWVGADVVEVAPAYDHAQITALAAATIATEWLALVFRLFHHSELS